jgi:hypothetical protein
MPFPPNSKRTLALWFGRSRNYYCATFTLNAAQLRVIPCHPESKPKTQCRKSPINPNAVTICICFCHFSVWLRMEMDSQLLCSLICSLNRATPSITGSCISSSCMLDAEKPGLGAGKGWYWLNRCVVGCSPREIRVRASGLGRWENGFSLNRG